MYKRILIPLDGTDLAEQAIPHARDIAASQRAEVHLLTVLDSFEQVLVQTSAASGIGAVALPQINVTAAREARKAQAGSAQDYLQAVARDLGSHVKRVTTSTTEGTDSKAILQVARDHGCDLIVIATHGRSGPMRTILGSVADEVMRKSHIPVLMVNPED